MNLVLDKTCLENDDLKNDEIGVKLFWNAQLNCVESIDLVTVFDAILTSRQTREKLKCLYENLMSNNFRRTAVLKKYDL